MSTTAAPAKKTMPTPREILLNAAEMLETVGWTQGTYGQTGQVHCAVGALMDAGRKGTTGELYQGSYRKAWVALQNEIARPTANPEATFVSIIGWNDKPGRTAEEVIQAMRAAAREVSA